MLAVHRVPGGILQAGVYLAVARDERQVECLHLAAGDEAQAGIAGGGHQIEAPSFISATISSEVAAVLTLTLQPVSFSKPVTQS